MNDRRGFKISRRDEKEFSVHPKPFIFIDKRTGTHRFEVKANVSSLLVKFDVAGRMGLARKAADFLSVEKVSATVELPQLGAVEDQGLGQENRISRESLVPVNALERRSRG